MTALMESEMTVNYLSEHASSATTTVHGARARRSRRNADKTAQADRKVNKVSLIRPRGR